MDNFHEIYKISDQVFKFAEIGSKEFKTSKLLSEFLKKKGFKVKKPYLGMETAFRAEYGSGKPVVGLLCEEDALPNGHSCGHNLIAAWAVGTAVKLKGSKYPGKIVVLGTPSEEGIGEYAGSKDTMVKRGAFKDIDFVIGMHPDSGWNVGSQSDADVTFEISLTGKSSHLEEADKGRNALDAFVAIYTAIRNVTAAFPKYKHILTGVYLKEGGAASNVIPERVIFELDLRSTDSKYLNYVVKRMEQLVRSVSKVYGVKSEIKQTTPIYMEYKNADKIDEILYKNLLKYGVKAKKLYKACCEQSGATDEANVSWVVPTGHLDIKIAPVGVPGHSDKFRESAGSKGALKSLKIAILSTVQSCNDIAANFREMKLK